MCSDRAKGIVMWNVDMISTEHWLVHEHTQFEVCMKECRNGIEILDWWAAEQFFRTLSEELRHHMAQEEEVLFPAYEKECGSSQKETLELYNEHSVIIDSFRRLRKDIDNKASKDAYDSVMDLQLLLVEHHRKEEETFLPFASSLLFEGREELVVKLNNFVLTDKSRNWGMDLGPCD